MRATRLEVSDILGVRQVDLILPKNEPVPWVAPKRCTGYIREGRSVDPEQLELDES